MLALILLGTPVTLEVTSLGARQTRLCVQAAHAVVDRVAARLHLAASPAQGQPARQ